MHYFGLSYGFLRCAELLEIAFFEFGVVGTCSRKSSSCLRAINFASIARILPNFEADLASFLPEESVKFIDKERGKLRPDFKELLDDLDGMFVADDG